MPEGPEVETVRRGLEKSVLKREMLSPLVFAARVFRQADTVELAATLSGNRFISAGRIGKFLFLPLSRVDAGAEALVIHLGMTGQLLLTSDAQAKTETPPAAHTHLVLRFADGGSVTFFDPRRFGRVYLDDLDPGTGLPRSLGSLGPDALGSSDPLLRARAKAAKSVAPVKAVLLDQGVIAGVGNIYSDEALHRAGLRPARKLNEIGAAEFERLEQELRAVLQEAVDLGGSTLSDNSYRSLDGVTGGFQSAHRVYARAGQACPTCASIILRTKIAGRSSYYCPTCQA